MLLDNIFPGIAFKLALLAIFAGNTWAATPDESLSPGVSTKRMEALRAEISTHSVRVADQIQMLKEHQKSRTRLMKTRHDREQSKSKPEYKAWALRQGNILDRLDIAEKGLEKSLQELAGLQIRQASYAENRLRSKLSRQNKKLLDSLGKKVAAGDSMQNLQGSAEETFNSVFQSDEVKPESESMDIDSLVQWVLRESYTETTEDLRFYAEKVSFYNQLKNSIREELTAAREIFADNSDNDEELSAPYQTSTISNIPDSEFNVSISDGDTISTKAELDSYIEQLETQLNTVGDDAQLANVELQNMLQKQQQTMQMISNVSKMLHDTAMAVIRKIGG